MLWLMCCGIIISRYHSCAHGRCCVDQIGARGTACILICITMIHACITLLLVVQGIASHGQRAARRPAGHKARYNTRTRDDTQVPMGPLCRPMATGACWGIITATKHSKLEGFVFARGMAFGQSYRWAKPPLPRTYQNTPLRMTCLVCFLH